MEQFEAPESGADVRDSTAALERARTEFRNARAQLDEARERLLTAYQQAVPAAMAS